MTPGGIDPHLTDLIVCAIDYGVALGRMSSDLEPTDLVQSEIALGQARARFRAARQVLGLDSAPCDGCAGCGG